MMKKLLAALFAGWLALAPAQAANQGSVSVFTTGPHSANDFAVNSLNPALLAIFTCSWGPGAPANGPGGVPAAYQCWADTSASPVVTFNRYDGTNWVAFGKLNTSTHVWTTQSTGFGLTLGGNISTAGAFTMSGAFGFTGTLTATTTVTFPTIGTLATLAGVETLTNKTFDCSLNGCSVRLGSDVKGQLPIANGGTGQSTRAPALSALMPTPTRAGDIVYWNGSNWVTLAGNNSGTLTLQENASGVPVWASVAGTGTVTSVIVAAGAGISVSGTCTITTSGTCTVAVNQSSFANSLGADVLLSNTGNYFDGPSVAQGTSGTWFASGTVTVQDSGSQNQIVCKLWDGTTVISSAELLIPSGAPSTAPVALSGVLASPAANIRISCRDVTSTAGKIIFNATGNSKDSTVTAIRIQ